MQQPVPRGAIPWFGWFTTNDSHPRETPMTDYDPFAVFGAADEESGSDVAGASSED